MSFNFKTGMWEGYIYKIYNTNGMTDKVYIGQTITSIKKRYNYHVGRAKESNSKVKLYNSLNKYGVENFQVEEIYFCAFDNKQTLIDHLNEKEIFYIELYDSCEYGLNILKGGNDNPSYLNCKPIIQHDILGNVLCEYNSCKDAAESIGGDSSNLSRVCRNKTELAYGFRWVYKGQNLSNGELIINKMIKQFSLDGRYIRFYLNVADASKCLGMNPTHIYENCEGVRDSASGYVFRYYCDYFHTFAKPVIPNTLKKILQYSIDKVFIKTYKNLDEICEETGFNRDNIYNTIIGKSKTSNGYIWLLEGENIDEYIPSSLNEPIIQYSKNMVPLKTFYSRTDIYHELNIDPSWLSANLSGKAKTCYGYIFKYEKEELNKEFIPQNGNRKKIDVYNFQGELIDTLSSIKDVCDKFNVNKTSVRQCCLGEIHSVGYSIVTRFHGEAFDKYKAPKVKQDILQYSKDFTLLNRYKSILEASESTKINYSAIYNGLIGKSKKSGGFIWKYAS